MKFDIINIESRTEKEKEEMFKIQIKEIIDDIVSQNKDVYEGKKEELRLIKEELEEIAGGAIEEGKIILSKQEEMEKVIISDQKFSNLSVKDWLITKTKRFIDWFSGVENC